VDCYVENIFLDKGKVGLTLLQPDAWFKAKWDIEKH
jgi:hypothetical protein